MYSACMATKTISVDLEAYRRLVQARRHPKESFSQVIRRAVWPDSGRTCGAFRDLLAGVRPLPERVLERLERAQKEDKLPEDRWRGR